MIKLHRVRRGIALALMGALTAEAAEPWSHQDWAEETTALALLAADWAQTRDIARHPGLCETNPCLGRYPPPGTVNRWFLAAAAIQVLGARAFHGRSRTVWISGWIAVEGVTVYHNNSIGLAIRF